jgi:hypothetical protein
MSTAICTSSVVRLLRFIIVRVGMMMMMISSELRVRNGFTLRSIRLGGLGNYTESYRVQAHT